MARASKLKVFRTPIGFHDAYVAAPSQKAALEAWGSDANLFARGVAEQVTDPALTEEPLASPGKVVKRLRATAEEQIASVPAKPADREGEAEAAPVKEAAAQRPKPRPRPSRSRLDAAEAALDAANVRQAEARDRLAARQAELDRERHELASSQEEEHDRLTSARDQAKRQFEEAMRRWRE